MKMAFSSPSAAVALLALGFLVPLLVSLISLFSIFLLFFVSDIFLAQQRCGTTFYVRRKPRKKPAHLNVNPTSITDVRPVAILRLNLTLPDFAPTVSEEMFLGFSSERKIITNAV